MKKQAILTAIAVLTLSIPSAFAMGFNDKTPEVPATKPAKFAPYNPGSASEQKGWNKGSRQPSVKPQEPQMPPKLCAPVQDEHRC